MKPSIPALKPVVLVSILGIATAFGQTVVWDGGGDGTSWRDAANWNPDHVPAATNDVVIAQTNVTVVHSSGATTIRSLQCAGNLSLTGGSSLTVTNGASRIDGTLSMAYGTKLAARNTGTVLTVNGPLSTDWPAFESSAGATVRMPNLGELDARTRGVTLRATGQGSVVDLSAVTNVLFAGYWGPRLYAESGGRIDLSQARIRDGRLIATASGAGSLVDLSAVTGVLSNTLAPTGYQTTLEASDGGEIHAPGLTGLYRADLTCKEAASLAPIANLRGLYQSALILEGTTNDLPLLVDLVDASLETRSRGVLRLPNIRFLDLTDNSLQVSTSGTNSLVDLSAVTNVILGAGESLRLTASSAGKIDLSSAAIPDGQVLVSASGGGSLIDLSAVHPRLANSLGGQSKLEASSRATILLPGVSELDHVDVTVIDGGNLVLGLLRRITYATVMVNNTTLSWPGLVDIEGTTFSYANGGRIVFPPAVDFVVLDVQAPAAAVAGQMIDVVWSVQNQSTNDAGSPRADTVSLSRDRAVGNDIVLGTFPAAASLPAGTTTRQTNTVIVPPNLEGAYYLIVAADGARQFFEGDGETNNSFIAVSPMTISAPDLQVLSVTAPNAAPSGGTLDVTWVVKNTGSASANQPWQDRLYLATNSTSLSGAIPLRSVGAVQPLAPGTSYTNTQSVTVPHSVGQLPGPFFLTAVADWNDAQPESNETNNRTSRAITVTNSPRPDLAVLQVIVPPTASPGEAPEVIWAITNRGNASAGGVWSDAIGCSNSVAGMQMLALFDFTNGLAPGSVTWRTQTVTLPLLLPAGTNRFFVQTDWPQELLETDENNNLGWAAGISVVPPTLSLRLSANQVPEGAADPVTATLTRNGPLDQPLIVTLGVSDPAELAVPATVELAPGQATASGPLWPLRDGQMDGPKPVTVSASALGYSAVEQSLTVLDADVPRLTLTLASSNVLEGQTVGALVTSDMVLAQPAVVVVESSNPSQLSGPASVTIPAGSNACAFEILAQDDLALESPAPYTIKVSSPGFVQGEASVIVVDNDIPGITLLVARATVSEGDGPAATVATLTRSLVSDRSVTVELANDNPATVQVPAQVVIPARQAATSFPVQVVDDGIENGPRTVTLTPFVLASGVNERLAQGASATITVLDDDGPTLRLQVLDKVVAEGRNPATRLSVARNTPATNAIVVTLVSSEPSKLTVPGTVTLPVGAVSVTVDVATVDNGMNDGNQTITIIATAPGFTAGFESVVVTDLLLPDLVVENVTIPAAGQTGDYVSIGYRIVNRGLAATRTNFLTRVFLSSDAQVGGDTLINEFVFRGVIGAGQYFEQMFQTRLPQAPGSLYLVVQADADQAETEILEDNNMTISPQPIGIEAAYGAVVSSPVEVAVAGAPVPLAGYATNRWGAVAPFTLVNIHLLAHGTERIIAALTDAQGNFAATFQPLPGEAGQYEVFATHPGVVEAPVQDTFVLVGMQASPASVSLRAVEQTTTTNTVRVENLSAVPLTGLGASVLAKPEGVEVGLTLDGTSLPGLGSCLLHAVFTAAAGAQSGEVRVRVTSAEGAATDVSFAVSVGALQPRLVATPPRLVAGMVRGQQRTVTFQVVNEGGVETGDLALSLPVAAWLQVACPNPLPSLGPGQTNNVTLLLAPPADLPVGFYTGALLLSSANASLTVPFEFRALSEAKGDLRVTAVDELTTYAEGAPPVTGATVVVRDAVTKLEVGSGITDAQGQFTLAQLPEAYYEIEVNAPKHQGIRRHWLVLAGQTNELTAFLALQTVRYVWSVVPIETEDRYRIIVDTVFEANVPAPVITLEPKVIDLANVGNDAVQVDLRISNHGLIAAKNMRLKLPSLVGWAFTAVTTNIGTLPAKSCVSIPLRIERRMRLVNAARAAGGGGDPCTTTLSVNWQIECMGIGMNYSDSLQVINLSPNCVGELRYLHGECCWPGEASPPGIGPGFHNVVHKPEYGVGEFTCSLDLCNCSMYPPYCVEGSHSLSPDGLANKIKERLIAMLPETGCIVQDPEVTFSVSGNLCTCCDGNNISYEGSAGGNAEIGLEFMCGAVIGGGLPSIPGWTNVALEGWGGVGVRLKLSASAGLELTKECGEDVDVRLQGEGTLAALAGGACDVTASGTLVDGVTIGTNKFYPSFSGQLIGEIGIEGQITARISGSLKEGLKMELCGELWARQNMSGTLTAEVPVGEEVVSVEASMSFDNDMLLARAGACGGGGAGEAAAAAKDNPDVIYFTRNDLLRPEPEIRAMLGLTPLPRSGICAHVRLQLDQEAVVSRDAFAASLTLENGEPVPLEQVQLSLTVQDAEGQDVGDRFMIEPPVLEGLTAVDGTGVVAGQSSGTARWTIIPFDTAAPTEPTAYWVAGRMKYVQNGSAVTVPLSPTRIFVLPSPKLVVHYFHQRDVFSDDPYTDAVEPSLPYNLAVLIQNHGYGRARNFRITSGQPQIVENEKGLLIDFRVIATEVAGRNLVPSLTAEFGDINPGQTVIGRWLMTSTLQGLFIDYKASFEHIDARGEPKLSLIDELAIHEMIHLVQAGGAFEDGKPDFLVNDDRDPFARPDTLWLSDGTSQPVAVVEQATHDGAPTVSDPVVHLNAAMPPGWAYLRVHDPANGRFALVRVERSDGAVIGVGTNVWVTDRTFTGLGRRPLRENVLHLLDYHAASTEEVYTLTCAPLPPADLTPPSSHVAALPPQSGTRIPVAWEGQDNPGGSGLAFFDVYVAENRGPFAPWLQQTTLRGAVFEGVLGNEYAFYSVATDLAGNREPAPTTPDAMTTVTLSNRAPEILPLATQYVDEGGKFTCTVPATDPDLPNDRLSFSLISAPPGLSINPNTGALRWFTGEGHGPSTYEVSVVVSDNGVPALRATGLVTVVVREVNTAPVLSTIPSFTINEGHNLVITAAATDSDRPPNNLTYSLGDGAPSGASVDPDTGVFTWRPNATQGPSTNLITIIVRDDGTPGLSSTQQFTVVVLDTRPDVVVSLGSTNVLAGEAGSVPVWLDAGLALQSLTFELELDSSLLTDLALQPGAPEVGSAVLLAIGPNRWQVEVNAALGLALQGQLPLGTLSFAAVSNGGSGIVWLRAVGLSALRTDWRPITNRRAFPGHVIVVAEAPVLWCERAAGTDPASPLALLQVYGQPGRAYQLQWASGLGGEALWQTLQSFVQTDRMVPFSLTNSGSPSLFFRVVGE